MPKITDSEVPRGGFLGKVYPHFGHVPTGRSHVSTTSPSQPFTPHWTAGPGLARLLLQRQNGEACKMERGPLSGQGQCSPPPAHAPCPPRGPAAGCPVVHSKACSDEERMGGGGEGEPLSKDPRDRGAHNPSSPPLPPGTQHRPTGPVRQQRACAGAPGPALPQPPSHPGNRGDNGARAGGARTGGRAGPGGSAAGGGGGGG